MKLVLGENPGARVRAPEAAFPISDKHSSRKAARTFTEMLVTSLLLPSDQVRNDRFCHLGVTGVIGVTIAKKALFEDNAKCSDDCDKRADCRSPRGQMSEDRRPYEQ